MLQVAWVAWTPSNLACSSKEVLAWLDIKQFKSHYSQDLNPRLESAVSGAAAIVIGHRRSGKSITQPATTRVSLRYSASSQYLIGHAAERSVAPMCAGVACGQYKAVPAAAVSSPAHASNPQLCQPRWH